MPLTKQNQKSSPQSISCLQDLSYQAALPLSHCSWEVWYFCTLVTFALLGSLSNLGEHLGQRQKFLHLCSHCPMQSQSYFK